MDRGNEYASPKGGIGSGASGSLRSRMTSRPLVGKRLCDEVLCEPWRVAGSAASLNTDVPNHFL